MATVVHQCGRRKGEVVGILQAKSLATQHLYYSVLPIPGRRIKLLVF
jgi:hypothetical protein